MDRDTTDKSVGSPETVGGRTVSRLRGFTESLETGQRISAQYTVRKVILDISVEPYTPEMVRETRRILGASQALFAKFLGVTRSTVQKWERGQYTPKDIACRFMDEMRKHPKFWRRRFRELAKVVTPAQ